MSERLPGQDLDDERTPEQRWLAAQRWYFLDLEMSRVGTRLMRRSGLNFSVLTERQQQGKAPGQ